MKLDSSKLSLWGIYTILLFVVNVIIFLSCYWGKHMILEIETYVSIIPFAALQAFLLTRDRRIWHIIMPLMTALILLSIHLFDPIPEDYEFTALMLEIIAPPLYRLMCVLFAYFDTMSFPPYSNAYTITSGILMSVGLLSYKILIYWCVCKFAYFLRQKH